MVTIGILMFLMEFLASGDEPIPISNAMVVDKIFFKLGNQLIFLFVVGLLYSNLHLFG